MPATAQEAAPDYALSELNLSPLMLGTAQWGMPYGIANRSGRPTFEDVREMLAVAFDHGVNCLDTAASYGESEEVIGRTLAELKLTSRMVVITKIRHLPEGILNRKAAEAFVERSVEDSLRKLGLEALPVCLLHREQDFRYAGALLKLKQKGLVLHVGCSVTDPGPTRAILDSGLVEALQIPANLLDHRFALEHLRRKAATQGVALFVRSIYLQGLLLMPESEIPQELAAVNPVLKALNSLAAESGMSFSELALRYALSIEGVASAIVGVETVGQLRQNIAYAAAGPLDAELMSQVDELVPELPEWIIKPALWPAADQPQRKELN